MSSERYKLNTTGLHLTDAGVDPRLERVMTGLGMLTTTQLYGAMVASPDAFKQLLQDYDISYSDLCSLLEKYLSEEDRKRFAGQPVVEYGMGQLGTPPSTGRTVIRRDQK